MIEIKKLFFKYKSLTKNNFELHDVNFKIYKNEFVLLLGKSGSGKSTLAKIITGLENDYTGNVKILNTDIKKLKNLRELISISFQFPENQFFLETVLQELTFALQLKKINRDEIIMIVKNLSKMIDFPIEKYQHYSPFDLSSGFQRRLALGITLSLNTDIIFLDEPLCGIDNKGRKIFLKLFQQLKNNNKTIIYITHNPEEVFFLTDRIIIIDKGKIILNKRKNELFAMKEIPDNILKFLPDNFIWTDRYKKKGVKLEKNYYSPKKLADHILSGENYVKKTK